MAHLTLIDLFFIFLWLAWSASLFQFRRLYRKLYSLLSQSDIATLDMLGPQQGTLHIIEPVRWYLKLREFTQLSTLAASDLQSSSRRSQIRHLMIGLDLVTFLIIVFCAADMLIEWQAGLFRVHH